VQLTQVADLVRGVSYPKTDSRDDAAPGYVPVLRATNIQEARLVLESDLVYVAESNVSVEQRLRPGDIVVATSSGSKHLVGKSALLHSQWNGSFGAFCAGIRPKPNIESRYLAYFLQSPRYWREIGKKALGVNINNLRRGDLQTLSLPLPPAESQCEIVAEIEKQFSRLDEAVANLQRVKAKIKRFKSSVLAEAVAGRLVATGADIAGGGSEVENAAEAVRRIFAARVARSNGRSKPREPIPPSGELDELPKGWCWATVDQLAEVGTGATPNRSKALYYEGGSVPWVTSSVVNAPYVDEASEFVTSAALEQTNLTLYPPGTLLVAMYGEGKTRGKCSELRIAAATNQALAALQVDAAFRPYLKLFLEHNYEATRMVATGGVQPNLNLGLVRAIKVPLPPIAEQHRIVAEVDRRLSIAREVEAEIGANLKRAQALRQAVLAKAFSTH
jgi:type I restriction enzyme, S subunit